MGSTLDVIQTFGALAEVQVPNDRKMDGYDLSQVFKGTGNSPRKEFYYWGFGELHAVRSESWKLHIQQRQPVHYGNLVEMKAPELYHLEADISEKYDRYDAEPDVVVELQAKIQEHLKDVEGSTPDQLVIRIDN